MLSFWFTWVILASNWKDRSRPQNESSSGSFANNSCSSTKSEMKAKSHSHQSPNLVEFSVCGLGLTQLRPLHHCCDDAPIAPCFTRQKRNTKTLTYWVLSLWTSGFPEMTISPLSLVSVLQPAPPETSWYPSTTADSKPIKTIREFHLEGAPWTLALSVFILMASTLFLFSCSLSKRPGEIVNEKPTYSFTFTF